MIVSLLWLMSFFFALPLLEPYELTRLAAVICALLATAAAFVMRMRADGAVILPRSKLLVVAGLFWALAGVTAWLSDVRYLSLIAFSSFSLLPLAALTALWATPGQMRLMLGGAALGLGGLALWALVQYTILPEILVSGQVRHPFANPNSYAALLAVGIVPAWAGALRAGGLLRPVLMALAVLLILAVTVIGGRAVWLCMLGAFAVWAFVCRDEWAAQKKTMLVPPLALLGGLALVFFFPGTNVLITLAEGRAAEAALFGRGPIWLGAWEIFRSHIWTGTGIGTFFLYYPEIRPAADKISGGFMAHSDPLQFAVEMGVGALVLFYGFLLLAAWRMRGVTNATAWALFVALGIVVVHSHVDFNFYVASILLLAGLGLGWWMRLSAPVTERSLTLVIPWRQALGLVAIPVLAWVLTLQGLLRSEWQVNRARDFAVAGDLDSFGTSVNRANLTGFGMNARPYMMAAVVPLGILESRPALPVAEKQALYEQAAGLLDRAAALNPRLVAVPYYRARLAMLYRPDDAPAAEDWLRQALALQPGHLPSRMMLFDYLRAENRPDDAYAIMKAGLGQPYIKHDAAPFYDLVAVTALQRQDMATYEQALRLRGQLRRRQEAWPAPEFMPAGGDDILLQDGY